MWASIRFIGGEPMKLATKTFDRALEQVEGRADLLDHAVLHQHDAVGQGHRLDLIVSDVDDRGLHAFDAAA